MTNNTTDFMLERAKTASLNRDFDLAEDIYKQILRSDPDNVFILNELSAVYIKSGNDEDAMLYLSKILRLIPDDFSVMDSLGGVFRRLGRYKESLDILHVALKKGKNLTLIHYNMGQTYKLMGEYEKAEESFSIVIDKNPQDVLAYNHLGCIFQLENKHRKAIQTFNRALKIDPNHPILHFNCAKSFVALERYSEALKAYETALRSRPGWSEAMVAYADLLVRTKNLVEAQSILDQAKKFGIADSRVHNLQGRLAYAKGELDIAEDEFKEAIKMNPKDVDSQYLLGMILLQEQRDELAFNVFKKLDSSTSDLDIKLKMAKIKIRLDEMPVAEEILVKLHTENPENIEVLSLLGQLYILKGDEKKGNIYFARIQQYEPRYKLYIRDLAEMYFTRKEYKESLATMLDYLKEVYDDTGAWYTLSKIYEALGNIEKALESYNKLFSLAPLDLKLKEAVSDLCKKTDGNEAVVALFNKIIEARNNSNLDTDELERMLSFYTQLDNKNDTMAEIVDNSDEDIDEDTIEQLDTDNNVLFPNDLDSEEGEVSISEATIDDPLLEPEEKYFDLEDQIDQSFDNLQKDLDKYEDEIDYTSYDPLLSQDTPLDSDFLPLEVKGDFDEARNSEAFEEEEVLEIGERIPQEVIEEREEVQETDTLPPPVQYAAPVPPPPPPPPPPEPVSEPEIEAEFEEIAEDFGEDEQEEIIDDELETDAPEEEESESIEVEPEEEKTIDEDIVNLDIENNSDDDTNIEEAFIDEPEMESVEVEEPISNNEVEETEEHLLDEEPTIEEPLEDDSADEDEPEVEDDPVEEEAEAEDEPVEDEEPEVEGEPVEEEAEVEGEPVEEDEPEVESEPVEEEEVEEEEEPRDMEEEVKKALDELRAKEPLISEDSAMMLDLFEYLKGLCSHLPPEELEDYEKSDNRLYLEYLIQKLKGGPSLMEEAEVVKHVIEPEPEFNIEEESNHIDLPEETESSEDRVTLDALESAMDYLRSLSMQLPDKNLSTALDNNISKVLTKLNSIE